MSLSNDLEALLRNPPKGAWVERVVVKGRTYFYLRWREEGKKRSVKLTEEQAKMVKENLGKPKNSLGNCPNIPGYDEFARDVENSLRWSVDNFPVYLLLFQLHLSLASLLLRVWFLPVFTSFESSGEYIVHPLTASK